MDQACRRANIFLAYLATDLEFSRLESRFYVTLRFTLRFYKSWSRSWSWNLRVLVLVLVLETSSLGLGLGLGTSDHEDSVFVTHEA